MPDFTANVTATDNCTATPSLVITQSPTAGTLVSTGVTTVTITVTDAAGNFSTCSANFTVSDNTAPTIATCAPNQSAFANASCQAAVPDFTANVTANDNCTATPSLVITQSPAAGTMVSTGVTTVTITVTDAAGNFSTCSANFTVTDNTAPTIVTCAPNQSAFANASCQSAVPDFTANVTATDNCTATPSLVITQSPAAGTLVSTGVTTVTITVTDAAGNFSTCSANFTVTDNISPTIVTCAPNQSAFANASCQSAVPDFTANVTATDNCTATPSLVITQSPAAGTLVSTGVTTVTITVTDAAGNFSTCSANFTVTDNISPTIVTCAPNQSAFANASCQAAVPNFTANVTATDNCTATPSLVITQSPAAGTLVSTGVTTVTITVTDAAGNFSTCSANFTVTDNTNPTIVTCAPNQSAFANASCQSAVPDFTANVTATDNCTATPSLVITQSPTAGTLVSTGVTTVTITVTDAAGNFSTCSANFTVTDNISPTIVTCAPNQSAFANASCQSAVPNFTANVTATDNCTATPSLVITQSPAAGTLVSTGVTTVTITVTDAAGNFSTCSANFTVTDNTNPTIVTCAPNQSAFANASCQSAVPDFTANVTATDNCTATPSLVITQSPTAGTLVSTGVTTVTITVTDAAGNFSTCSANFTVTDNTAPTIVTCPATRNIEGCSASALTNPNYSQVLTLADYAIFSGAVNNGSANDNCGITEVSYLDITTGTCPVVVTRTWFIKDAYGNTSECEQQINIDDTTDPVLTCPSNLELNTNNGNTYIGAIGNAIATDNCDSDITITNNAPISFPLGNTIVTWTATDDCGNSTTCDQTVSVSSLPIIANDDIGSIINGFTGGTSVSDVLVNDLLNGLPVQASDITLSQVSSTNAGISLVGKCVVVAAGTPAGTYSSPTRSVKSLIQQTATRQQFR
ncbi:MAG: HYR domain-containing protein [Bacteroidales bacterium]|nr:HYR domain-containing protein [Bacteroidales bacterium]